ncbi:MAG: hypothetical protein K2L94_00915 [Alphaproteobacteria bacterium]|nr:hypothetical protein [Alphaproteobacteria bacterium]
MRRFFVLPCLIFGGFCACSAFADYTKNDTYCVIDYSVSGGQCYWCRAGGDTAAGNCRKGYAGCTSTTEKYVNVGSVTGGWWCSSNGFCKMSCDDSGHWAAYSDIDHAGPDLDGVEVWMAASGCECNQFVADTSKLRCAAGYYGTPDIVAYTGCQRCPGVTNANGDMVYGVSMVGYNNAVTDCWLEGGMGPFSDDGGIYDILSPMCAWAE